MNAAQRTALWCRYCGEPVTRSGSRTGPVVHAATGAGDCADGNHTAEPSATDPEMHRQAREISAEFGDRWRIAAELGGFYATPADAIGGTALPVDAATAGELRERLAARENVRKSAARDARAAAGQS